MASEGARVFSTLLAPGSESDAHAHYEARVAGRRVLLENADRAPPQSNDPGLVHRNARVRRESRKRGARAKKRESAGLSRQDKKNLGLLLPGKTLSYADALPLNALWTEYVRGLLGLDGLGAAELDKTVDNMSWVSGMQSSLLKADWTGAKMTVVQSTNPALVHTSGVVAQETHETFILINENGARVVPKRNCIFAVEIALDSRAITIDLHGNQLRYALPARATRKHKARKTIELD